LAGSHEDLAVVLKHIESQLAGYGFGWEHVLYIHLYIADMNEFATVNETCEIHYPGKVPFWCSISQYNRTTFVASEFGESLY